MHFLAFRTRGVGMEDCLDLAIRTGGAAGSEAPTIDLLVILYRPSSLYHNARGYKRRGPARYRIKAGVASLSGSSFFRLRRGTLSTFVPFFAFIGILFIVADLMLSSLLTKEVNKALAELPAAKPRSVGAYLRWVYTSGGCIPPVGAYLRWAAYLR